MTARMIAGKLRLTCSERNWINECSWPGLPLRCPPRGRRATRRVRARATPEPPSSPEPFAALRGGPHHLTPAEETQHRWDRAAAVAGAQSPPQGDRELTTAGPIGLPVNHTGFSGGS